MIKLRTLTKTTSGRVGRSSGNTRFLLSTGLAFLAAVGAADIAQAQTWTGAVNTDYGTVGNWDNLAVPGVGDAVVLDNGLTFNAAGAFAADSLQVTNGNALITAGGLTITTGAGTVTVGSVPSAVPATLQLSAGTTLAATTLTLNSKGELTTNGAITATTVNVTEESRADVGATGSITGAVNVRDAATLNMAAGGASIVGNVDIDGSRSNTTIGAGSTVTGNVSIDRGTLNVNGAITGTLTGIGGTNTVSVIGAGGSVGGLTDVTGLSNLSVSGALNGGLTSGNRSVVDVQTGGGVTGPVIVNGGDVSFATGSTLTGAVTLNTGTLTTAGTAAIVGNVTLNGGSLSGTGTLTGDLTIAAPASYNAGGLVQTGNVTNNGTFNVATGNHSAGTVDNNGLLTIADTRTLTATAGLNNNGIVNLGAGTAGSIAATIAGDVTGGANSELRLQNRATGDTLTVTGNLTGTNTVYVDGALNVPGGGSVDTVVVNGNLDGDVTVRVRPIQDYYALQNPIVVVDAGSLGGSVTTSLEGLPQVSDSLILFSVAQNAATSNIELQSQINPAVGGVAAAVSSISSLIGTVINRPSGAFVSGIAFDTPGNCSTGTWVRATGGRMAADVATVNNTGTSITSSGITEFGGIQGGLDFGCFEAFNGGWDVSAGLLVGSNQGWFSQFSGSGELTRGDFDQYFFGGYVAVSTGNWSGEMQLRHETGDMIFNNQPLSLSNSELSFSGYAISGSVTYRHALDNSWSLLPTAGFAVSHNEVSALQFTNGPNNIVGAMQVEDHTNKTTFVGATFSKTIIDAANASAASHFITATYYQDHSGSRSSVFTTVNNSGSASLTTDEIGNFGEISVGTSYVKLLSNNPGSIRQLNASVRTDWRFGGEVEGASLTAQMRLQF